MYRFALPALAQLPFPGLTFRAPVLTLFPWPRGISTRLTPSAYSPNCASSAHASHGNGRCQRLNYTD